MDQLLLYASQTIAKTGRKILFVATKKQAKDVVAEKAASINMPYVNELTHEVSVTFILPEDARAVRLDPGELACCITDLAISDERISFQPVNGLVLQEDSLLFLDVDPNLSLHCTTGFGAGMKFAVNYHYYPLGRFLHEQPGKSLLRALNDLKLKNAAAAQEAAEVLQASRAECMRLNQQLLTLQGIQHEYQVSLETMRASSSWRLTAPLRRLLNLLRGGH